MWAAAWERPVSSSQKIVKFLPCESHRTRSGHQKTTEVRDPCQKRPQCPTPPTRSIPRPRDENKADQILINNPGTFYPPLLPFYQLASFIIPATQQAVTMFNMSTLLNQKDSRWLQLEVCRENQRQKCTRSDADCKFAHPPTNVEVQNGRVTACYDSIKVGEKRISRSISSTE